MQLLQYVSISLAAALLLALQACVTGPNYGPRDTLGETGYFDEQISATRYRVTFAGDSDTSRSAVEDFLTRRAAEITMQAGFTYFVFDNRTTEARTRPYTVRDSWNPENGLLFGLGRRYAPPSNQQSQWTVPVYSSDAQAEPFTRYTASSDIVLLTPEQAAREPTALSVKDILMRLGPRE